MMPGIGRIKDGVHPAVGLITRGNFPCWCFSEPRHYFWQGWGCQAAMEELQGAARGLLGATAPSLLPQGSPGWQGGSRQQRLKSSARGFSGSGQQHGKGNNCCCLPLAAHALGKKICSFWVLIFTSHWAIPRYPDLCSRSRVSSTSPYKNIAGNTAFHIFKLT